MNTTTKSELRLTDTNAASDSKGRTWGLEGGLFWWLVGGLGIGITVFFIALVVASASLFASVALAAIPVMLALAYIFGLRQGKPPGYDRDIFEHAVASGGFQPDSAPAHPLYENKPNTIRS
jgi:hypothetical protein